MELLGDFIDMKVGAGVFWSFHAEQYRHKPGRSWAASGREAGPEIMKVT